ncbi:hypothetical protein MCHI_002560 [Candidatus Magnetoovum chiemensis]|nr:hypothetical protein MCHI_002560 [Candidatus Magnetoovum chiemensis]
MTVAFIFLMRFLIMGALSSFFVPRKQESLRVRIAVLIIFYCYFLV